MENIEIEVPMQLLDAALICVAKKDVRFYLCAIALDDGHIVSTDGYRGFACEVKGLKKDMPQIIMPSDAVRYFLKKIPPVDRSYECHLKVDFKNKKAELHFSDASESFTLIDAKYPNWQPIFPNRLVEGVNNDDYPQFNWAYLTDFQKVQKALGGSGKEGGVRLYPTGKNTAAVIGFENTNFNHAKGAVMPLRS
ncbi:hypothetical protein [Acinetobacter wuhouensis]|uniref:DNA polymerase III beta sliding clamp central domain-containing protein n=1 Tax=Acinetobacter wuhouensis TaxID=1879050 RepID=A0A4Q7AH13_9GAMM|nr:hypothetical protein [Acinetobacter wuhouensis]RZG47016.1 hypothetical protein EXU28_07450 [Acinetobacter wuhouensis]